MTLNEAKITHIHKDLSRLLIYTKIMIYKRKNDKVEFIKIFKLHPLEKKNTLMKTKITTH